MKKLFTIVALLCVTMMGWATKYCGETITATDGATTVTITCTNPSPNTYVMQIVGGDNFAGLIGAGNYCHVNDAGTNLQILQSSDFVSFDNASKTLTITLTSTGGYVPVFYNPLYLDISGQKEFTTIQNQTFEWPESCSGKPSPNLTITSSTDVVLDGTVIPAATSQITATRDGAATIEYSSDAEGVATVSNSGLITAVSQGTATITVHVDETGEYEEDSKTVTVHVVGASQCEGDLGHFATFNNKRIHYKIEYLPTPDKIRYEVRGYDTQVLDYCVVNTTSGSSNALPIVDGVAVWKQDAPAAGTEIGVNFLFSTDAIGGNEMNAETTTLSFTGNNEHLVYYVSHACEIAEEPAYAPTTTPDENTMYNDCQIYSILGSDYYMSAGFNNETNAWGGGTATTETIDGRQVLHIANSNYLERGFNPHDVSGYTHIHFDVWCAEALPMRMKLMAHDNGWKEGSAVAFSTNKGAWNSVDLALSDFNHSYLNQIQGIYPLDMNKENVYFTNIYFYKTTDDISCYETLNLAEGKPSEAGYEDGNPGETAAKANDGSTSSKWVTWDNRPASEEWWYVDLKNNYDINRVEIVWDTEHENYSTEFILQTRTEAPSAADKGDDTKWVDMTTDHITNTSNAAQTINVTDVSGRYVRFHSLARNGNCIRLAELRVFGTGYATTDVNDPEITTAEVADDSENYTSVKLHLVATDIEDGSVKTFLLNKGDDNWLPIITDANDCYTVADLARGHYSYQVQARDHAGRVSEISTITFNILNPNENLALNRTTVVAGYTNPDNAGEVPTKANDGNLGSPWTTYTTQAPGYRPMDEQWWSVELDDVYQLSGIDLFWAEGDRSDHYLIQVSHSEPTNRSDDTQWYTILEVDETQNTGQAEGNKNHYALDASARYVRFKAVTKNSNFLKLWELRLFGSAYAEEDLNAPEITTASVSYNDDGKAYLNLTATDSEDGVVKSFRLINTTTGDKKVLTTDGENKIAIEGLEINTLYEYEVQAMDKAANLSAVRELKVRVPELSSTNIAAGKNSYAGYEDNNDSEHADAANDGRENTAWVTWSWQDPSVEWWYVDLEDVYHITNIEVVWGDDVPTSYIVQTRIDAPADATEKAGDEYWATIGSIITDATANSTKYIENINRNAQYVRLHSLSKSGSCIRLKELRVYADAKVIILSEENNSSFIAANDEATVNVELSRTFPRTNEWFTICLPFDLDEAQMEAAFGAGYKLAELVGSEDRGSLIHLNFDYVTALTAGKAYLLEVPSAINDAPTFNGVVIKDVNPAALKSVCTHMHFQGTFDRFLLEGADKRFVSQDNYLYAPQASGTWMGAFRCFFTIPSEAPAGVQAKRARIMFAPQVVTGMEEVHEHAAPAKFMLDGVLYIIRDGRTYNAQGMLVK